MNRWKKIRSWTQVCQDGSCGGECFRCQVTSLTAGNIRLEAELRDSRNLVRGLERAAANLREGIADVEASRAELLDVLKKTAPILDQVYVEVGSQAVLAGGDPRGWKLVRDLVELTIKILDPDWESPREQAEADALARRN